MTRPDDTHYVRHDEPVGRYGMTTAVCGRRVNSHHGETDDQDPTCERCRAWIVERNRDQVSLWEK